MPQLTDLLWVYEGMNQYLGDLLSFRAGIREPKSLSANISRRSTPKWTIETGRATTPLIDLTTGAPYFYVAHGAYPAIRRNAGDFYTEGELVWLDVDTIIRERSHGARSLDTFLHRFTEPAVTGPIVVTYTRAQVESLLNGVEPYDWHAFFDKYVYHVAVHPPTDELARAGWRIVYTGSPNEFITAQQAAGSRYRRMVRLRCESRRRRRREGRARELAGLAKPVSRPDMHVLAVDGQQFSADVLEYAVKRAAALRRADLADYHAKRMVPDALARLSRGNALPASRANRGHDRHAGRDRRSSRQVVLPWCHPELLEARNRRTNAERSAAIGGTSRCFAPAYSLRSLRSRRSRPSHRPPALRSSSRRKPPNGNPRRASKDFKWPRSSAFRPRPARTTPTF